MFVVHYTDHTPREKAARQIALSKFQWRTYYPLYTNLGCIGQSTPVHCFSNTFIDMSIVITFSIIAPLILALGCVAFAVLRTAHRYSLLYITSTESETGGSLYPRALLQLFTVVYALQLCLIGLFILEEDSASGISRGVLILMLALTAVYRQKIKAAYDPYLGLARVINFNDRNDIELQKHVHDHTRLRQSGESTPPA